MKSILTSLLALASYALYANSFAPDTIIIRLSNGEEVMIVSENDNEVELLQQYDMNAILRDLQRDTTQEGSIYIEIQDQTGSRYDLEEENDDDLSLEEKLERLERKMERAGRQREYTAESSSSGSTQSSSHSHSRRRRSGTSSTMMFDFGLNNYLLNGRFPDETNELYTVKPLVSWNIALGVTNTTKIAGPLYLEWGGNINWYNFKFENDRVRMEKTDDGVVFFEDLDVVDPRKSKFVVPYLNAQMVSMFQFGKARRDGWFPLDRDDDSGFRIGMGGYVGYRVGSRHKYVIRADNRIRVKNRVNYFVNNWRYGVRFQLGFRSFDFYANYDLNELFIEGKGPELNAFSFGIMF
ncbi:MAG: hypothetical protein ACFB15_27695 [Cyclobacteriaceae bacterium]